MKKQGREAGRSAGTKPKAASGAKASAKKTAARSAASPAPRSAGKKTLPGRSAASRAQSKAKAKAAGATAASGAQKQASAAAARLMASTAAHAVTDRLLALIGERWERRSQEYEEAKKLFEGAAAAARGGTPQEKGASLRKDLSQFAVEMRLQAARRAELDWVRHLLQNAQKA